MAPADHAIRDDRGEQRFDGGEQRDREGGSCQDPQPLERDHRQRRTRQTGVNFAEPCPDRLHRQMPQLHDDRRHDERHEGTRDAPADSWPGRDDGERGNRDDERPGVERIEGADIGAPLGDERRRHRRHLETEQIADLTRENDERDAARESDCHRIGNELDRGAPA